MKHFRQKRRLQHTVIFCAALMLCAATLCGSVFATAGEGTDPFDYGKSGMTSNETMDALTLFEAVFGVVTDPDERAYLDALCTLSLTYNSAIPDSTVSTYYDKDGGALDVSLSAYRFTASNGATVSWIPVEARIEDRVMAFTLADGVYSCRFEELYEIGTGNFDIEVDFEWTAKLPEDAAEQLLNAAFYAGSEALEPILKYESAYAVYKDRLEKYLTYQAYLEAVQAYADYQTAMAQYESDKQAYDAYLELHKDYAEKLAAYEAWQHYYAYQDFLKNDLENYNAYLTYQGQVEKVTKKLSVIESLFVADSHGWQLYASLMGGTVSFVLEEAQIKKLITAGCNANDVNAAGEATRALRVLMKGYADLRDAEYASEHERLTALYTYYTAHYEELRDGFSKLYGALKALCGNSIVTTAAESEGKLEHLKQFVGQLYITTICLDDGRTWLSNWSVCEYKLEEVVEEIHRLTDFNNAAPGSVTMPETEVPVVEKVEPIDEPTVEYVKDKPEAPSPVVKEPIQPTEVKDPSLGTVPDEAEHPGDAPTEPQIDSRLRALADKVLSGSLTARKLADYPRTLTLKETVTRLVAIDNRKTVTFLGVDGKTVLDRQVVEYGSKVYYKGADTALESDAQYSYVFLGWIQADGSASDFIADEDLTLYANYNKLLRHYSVTWILDGKSVTTHNVAYGTVPKSPFDVNKAPDEHYSYAFSGWYLKGETEPTEIPPVTGDVTYTGSIKAIPKLFTVTWELGDRTVTQQVAYGSYPKFEGEVTRAPDACSYTFVGWDRPLEAVAGDVTYTARYSETKLATNIDGTVAEVIHTDGRVTVLCTQARVDIREAAHFAQEAGKALTLQWERFSVTLEEDGLNAFLASHCRQIKIVEEREEAYGTVYTFGYCNNLGTVQAVEIPATLSAVADESGNARAFFLANGNEWIAPEGNAVKISCGATLRVSDVYAIQVGAVTGCNLSTLPSKVAAGSTVDLRLGCVFGYEISAARVTLADGSEVAVSDDLTFVMPLGDVSITLTVSRIVYHVTFVSDGVAVSEADYFLGDPIVIPPDPTKASDGVYDYVFMGWSQDATLAMGDERNPIYEAVYSATPVLNYDPYGSGNNNNVFMTVVLPIVGAVVLLGAAALVTWQVLKKRKPAPMQEETEIPECAETEAEPEPLEAENEETNDPPSQEEP